MNDADDFGGDVLVDVVGDGDAGMAIADQRDCHIDALQESDRVDAAKDEAAFIEGFGAFGGGADAHGGERMADARKERTFLRQGTRIRDDREGIHLQAVVVMEAERLVLDHARIQLKAGGFQTLA